MISTYYNGLIPDLCFVLQYACCQTDLGHLNRYIRTHHHCQRRLRSLHLKQGWMHHLRRARVFHLQEDGEHQLQKPKNNTHYWKTVATLIFKVIFFELTWTRNNQVVPTSTPGILPKWLDGTILHFFVLPTQAMPLPQSRFGFVVVFVCVFLDSFNFPPALTISFVSSLQVGQYLKCAIHRNSLFPLKNLKSTIKVNVTTHQSSSFGTSSKGGVRHAIWYEPSHSSHNIWVSSSSFKPQTLQLHSLHFLVGTSLHVIQTNGPAPLYEFENKISI